MCFQASSTPLFPPGRSVSVEHPRKGLSLQFRLQRSGCALTLVDKAYCVYTPKPLQLLVSIEGDHHGKASLAATTPYRLPTALVLPHRHHRLPVFPNGLATSHKYGSSNQISLKDRHQLRLNAPKLDLPDHLWKRPPSTSADHHPNSKRYS